jgi:hypothetical protein
MKQNALKFLLISLALTMVGYLMDNDPKDSSLTMQFLEFLAMLVITFLLVTGIYYLITFMINGTLKIFK